MKRVLLILLTGLLTSFFLFPFNLPVQEVAVNTKMILAVIGVGLLFFASNQGQTGVISRDFFVLCLIGAVISVWALFASVYNGTAENAFAKYLISIWVWMGAAYSVVWFMRAIHGAVTVELIGIYLASVCVAQCALAYSMTIWPSLGVRVDSIMGAGEAFMSTADGRIHGLGAALDPAGLRFSGVLVILSYLYGKNDVKTNPGKAVFYLLSFFVITILGNMIARTTTIGVVVGILVLLSLKHPRRGVITLDNTWLLLLGILSVVILISVILYNSSSHFREDLRFGFEGFFSLAETGRWKVHSNDLLKGMIVWPESLKTWIVGDGYFENPLDIPNRFGQVYEGFYMKTDIGYLRYIFYFGCVGLLLMIILFVQMTVTCIKNLRHFTLLFIALLLVNMLGWLKVSSDIIMVFAPFLILAYMRDDGLRQE